MVQLSMPSFAQEEGFCEGFRTMPIEARQLAGARQALLRNEAKKHAAVV